MMLPSFNVQIFNTVINLMEVILLGYIALQSWVNNQATKDKQFHTIARLDHLTDLTKDFIINGNHKNKDARQTDARQENKTSIS